MNALCAFLLSVFIVVAAKTLPWLLQRRSGNAGIVDAIWSWTLGLLAVFYVCVGSAPVEVRWLVGLMGGFWGLRLGTYIFLRNRGKPEDFRYAELRNRWGAKADFKLFWFFQFQNIFTLLLSASAYVAASYRQDMPPLVCLLLSAAIWLLAFGGEALADAQMQAFRTHPANKGRVCREGLWRWSRHPNYFFECLHWLAYLPLALGAPWGWTALIAPLVMAWLLMKLSGVPLLEAEMIRRKPDYAEYVRTTSALVPWPPKKS